MPAYNYLQPNYMTANPYYYPQNYQPIVQPQMIQPQQVQTTPQNVNQVPSQIQNGGFIPVRSESEARSYPVAPGTSVTFKHETAPYCYTKTLGLSQFEAPKFEKYRLVKEEEETDSSETKEDLSTIFATKEEIGKVVGVVKGIDDVISALKSDVEAMKGDMYGMAGRKKVSKKASEVEDE